MNERAIEKTKAEIKERLAYIQHSETGPRWQVGYMEGVRAAFKVLQECVYKATPVELADGDFYLNTIASEKEWFEETFKDFI